MRNFQCTAQALLGGAMVKLVDPKVLTTSRTLMFAEGFC